MNADRFVLAVRSWCSCDAYILPYRSIGADLDGKALMDIFRQESAEPSNDRHLVDRWAEQLKLIGLVQLDTI